MANFVPHSLNCDGYVFALISQMVIGKYVIFTGTDPEGHAISVTMFRDRAIDEFVGQMLKRTYLDRKRAQGSLT